MSVNPELRRLDIDIPAQPDALVKLSLLMADEEQAPELNAFVAEMCRSAGFFPALFPGSVQTLRAAADLVAQGRCVLCTPSATAGWPGDVVWRPLGPAAPRYPWSIMWRTADPSPQALDLVATARRLAAEHSWRGNEAEETGKAS